jgi:hypothetical protein
VTGVPLVTAPTPPLTLPVPLLKTAVRVVELPKVIVAAADMKLVATGAGTTVSVADCSVLLKLAWMCAVALLTTEVVVTANCALVWPAATATAATTCAAAISLVSATVSPPEAAGPLKVTVAVVAVPPVTVACVSTMDVTVGAFMVSAAVCGTPYVAVMVACVEALTAAVVTWNVAVDWPAATVAVAGTVAELLLLASITVAAAAATPLSVTVPVDAVPPVTAAGFNPTEVSAGLIMTARSAVAVCGVGVAESVTVTVNEKVPKAVGVPDSKPAELSVIPAGTAPLVTAHV